MPSVNEIRNRLIERGASQSSQNGSGAQVVPSQKLAKPVVHESLYVYAADKINGGIALAEKWQLTLVQKTTTNSSSQKRETRRKSVLAGVDTTGLLPENPF